MTKNIEVLRYEKRLNYLFEQTKLLPEDSLVRSHWARYLCILLAGYLETSVRALYCEYARNKSAPYVANYIENRLKSFQSASMENILQLTRMFNSEWAECLQRETEGELADAVNSIVNNRHQIVHGKDTGVSLAYVATWYKKAVKVVNLVEDLCS